MVRNRVLERHVDSATGTRTQHRLGPVRNFHRSGRSCCSQGPRSCAHPHPPSLVTLGGAERWVMSQEETAVPFVGRCSSGCCLTISLPGRSVQASRIPFRSV